MSENSKKSDNKSATEEAKQQKRCFVIMPFSDPEGYDKGHFRKVYEQIIKPAVESAGYESYRVDENGVSDLITTKIFKAILDCDMAICDLSSRNPNVLYELGIRHAFDKPVVLIKDNKTDRIFDIQGISTVDYRCERLYDEVIEDQKKISEAIKANENNSSGYSILNMVNLQKATYDISIKDINPSEINNALLMRVINALDKVEQNQNDFNKQALYTRQQHSSSSRSMLKSSNDVAANLIYFEIKIKEINDEVKKCNINTSFNDLKIIEETIIELRLQIMEFFERNSLTDTQKVLVVSYISNTGSMLEKINVLKEQLDHS